ncbi:MAG TPA: metal-sulfur cluster assembly factor [Opitutaceae bacterium]
MSIDREIILNALRDCRDPEIPVNIVDLGLIYEVVINESPEGADIEVQMTLTSTGCPMSRSIVTDVQRRLLAIAGVASARVEVTWEPSWHPDMISEDGRRQLQIAS